MTVDFAALVTETARRLATAGPVTARPTSLFRGHPGIAMLFGELGRADEQWLPVAHRHLAGAVAALDGAPASGLYEGPAAVLAAAQTCAAGTGRYRGLRERLTAYAEAAQAHRLTRRAPGPGVSCADYDVVNGVTGLGRVLLDAGADIRPTLDALVRLTRPVEVRGRRVPGWWVPADRQPAAGTRREWPGGSADAGMAHGVAGVLAFLALAAERGRLVPGQRDAMYRIAGWLGEVAGEDAAGPYFPARAGVAGEPPVPAKSAWCYGAPGVAVALHRAGSVLGEPTWQRLAAESLRAVSRRPEADWHLDGPTVCHGYAGLLRALFRVGTAAGDPDLLAVAGRVALRVAACADETAEFLFRHHEAGSSVDSAGLVEGAAGVACALLPFAGYEVPGPSWDRVLLFS
ncbi:lanthionine synthetase C family protein [Amycolatopsis sp. NBC_01488]|uniref:lanthionine synthetase C family protein n=1 Tax=Amycolatopsis sp. NBC_01488 TaxID=2903563 RepID=UPI002E29F56B|nr:lanthionine synthetase C family protein [Amycolatopsis sp. NBC_01488]